VGRGRAAAVLAFAASARFTIGIDGHIDTGHSPQCGVGALQIARPCKINQ
jgi:hypothetical protein